MHLFVNVLCSTCKVSYSGGKGGYLPPNFSFSLLDFRPNLFQHATTSQLQPSGAPKATSSNLGEPKFIKCPEEAPPNLSPPPLRSNVLHFIEFSPP